MVTKWVTPVGSEGDRGGRERDQRPTPVDKPASCSAHILERDYWRDASSVLELAEFCDKNSLDIDSFIIELIQAAR